MNSRKCPSCQSTNTSASPYNAEPRHHHNNGTWSQMVEARCLCMDCRHVWDATDYNTGHESDEPDYDFEELTDDE